MAYCGRNGIAREQAAYHLLKETLHGLRWEFESNSDVPHHIGSGAILDADTLYGLVEEVFKD